MHVNIIQDNENITTEVNLKNTKKERNKSNHSE